MHALCERSHFNTTWFVYMLQLIGLSFLTHPPNKRKRISNRFQETCRSTRYHCKMLGTGLSLNVSMFYITRFYRSHSFISWFIKCQSKPSVGPRMKTEKKEIKTSDYEFSENVVLRSVKDHIERAGICAPSFPEPQTMIDEREQLVLEQLINFSREIGDILDQDSNFKNMVDGFANVVDPQHFQSLVEKMLVDDITWGKIITLICVIGKTVAKIIGNSLPSIVLWTLNYFKDKLQNWICSRGGWVSSISSLARYSFERDFGSSSSPISLSSGVMFISGALVGGFIVWRLQKGA